MNPRTQLATNDRRPFEALLYGVLTFAGIAGLVKVLRALAQDYPQIRLPKITYPVASAYQPQPQRPAYRTSSRRFGSGTSSEENRATIQKIVADLFGTGFPSSDSVLNTRSPVVEGQYRVVPDQPVQMTTRSGPGPERSYSATLTGTQPQPSQELSDADRRWRELLPHPCVACIFGGRDSGKSALGFRSVELLKDNATPFLVGLPRAAWKLVPPWMGLVDRLEDLPVGAVALIDEAYLAWHSRASMSSIGRSIGAMVNLSRQRRQTLIFVVQEARQLDVNVVSQADVIAVKRLTELSREFERKELLPLLDRARSALMTVPGDTRRWTWVHSEKTGFEGLVANDLPSFWTPALSHAYASGPTYAESESGVENTGGFRTGTRTPREELAAKAKAMHAAGMSYGQIARALGVAKSTAYDLVNRSTEPKV